jgi:hypothetical protein
MKYIILVFPILLAGACNKSEDKVHNIPLIKEIITAYTNSADTVRQRIGVFVVNLTSEGDSLTLVLANTYPEVEKMKFNLDTTINGFRLLFTGEKIQGYSNERSEQTFPKDIIAKTQDKLYWFNTFTRAWVFDYRKDKMIYYFPKKDIEQFFPAVFQIPYVRSE